MLSQQPLHRPRPNVHEARNRRLLKAAAQPQLVDAVPRTVLVLYPSVDLAPENRWLDSDCPSDRHSDCPSRDLSKT